MSSVKNLFSIFFSFILISSASGQTRTVGLTKYNQTSKDGYMLISPMNSKKTYLVDNCGKSVHEWSSSFYPGLALGLSSDGSLFRTGTKINPYFGLGVGGVIQKFDWSGNMTWQIFKSDSNEAFHHDIHIMPNGNILAIVWEKKTIAECIAKGRNPSKTSKPIWSERIVEIQPIGADSFDVVWEWTPWDHLIQDYSSSKPNYGVVKDHPELFDINYFETDNDGQDWFHFNSINYNPVLDQIIVTSHSLCEFYIIDHSTNSLQAAAHKGGNRNKGGDILFRWGNPQAYGRGTESERRLFKPHHAHWIPNEDANGGSIMIYNNGWGRPDGAYSTVDIIKPTTDVNGNYTISSNLPFAPSDAVVAYKAPKPTDFYSQIISGAFSLPDGGLFITCGTQGRIFQTDANDSIVWQYINPITSGGILNQGQKPNNNNSVFRAEYYPRNFPAFTGKQLIPIAEIEGTPNSKTLCEVANQAGVEMPAATAVKLSPMPFSQNLHIENIQADRLLIRDISGRRVLEMPFGQDVDLSGLNAGFYLLEIWKGNQKIVLQVQKAG